MLHWSKRKILLCTFFKYRAVNNLTSIRSISFKLKPVTLRTFCIADTGPMPIILGSTPTVEYPIILAKGLRLCSLAAASLANTIAPAPSDMP